MKGHYIREAQPSGKLGRLAPYLKINEFPQLPKALKGPLRYCKSHSDMVSPFTTLWQNQRTWFVWKAPNKCFNFLFSK